MNLPRLFLLMATALLGASLATMASAQTAPKTPVASAVFSWDALAVKPTKIGERREVFDGPTRTLGNLECHVTTVNPGESPHAAHRHPDEELLFVKEGTIEVTINGAVQQAGPGSIVFFASGDLHGIRNTGAVPATYYVLRIVPHDLPKAATP
ncbi:MAG TPA: cupin domain-containing protein [Opitutaceae bacterium]|nr:cupin domain-containing protein [Opitutaceae bacterium]